MFFSSFVMSLDDNQSLSWVPLYVKPRVINVFYVQCVSLIHVTLFFSFFHFEQMGSVNFSSFKSFVTKMWLLVYFSLLSWKWDWMVSTSSRYFKYPVVKWYYCLYGGWISGFRVYEFLWHEIFIAVFTYCLWPCFNWMTEYLYAESDISQALICSRLRNICQVENAI